MAEEAELVMPFVVCQSNGGTYDDDAYVAGYEMGLLDQVLQREVHPLVDCWTQTIHEPNRDQADLIAMRHGFTMNVRGRYEGWLEVEFSKADG